METNLEKTINNSESRRNKLYKLGLTWDGQSFVYKDEIISICFHWSDIIAMTDDKFNSELEAARSAKMNSQKIKESAPDKVKLLNFQTEIESINLLIRLESEKGKEIFQTSLKYLNLLKEYLNKELEKLK